jgi:hypothetical protein
MGCWKKGGGCCSKGRQSRHTRLPSGHGTKQAPRRFCAVACRVARCSDVVAVARPRDDRTVGRCCVGADVRGHSGDGPRVGGEMHNKPCINCHAPPSHLPIHMHIRSRPRRLGSCDQAPNVCDNNSRRTLQVWHLPACCVTCFCCVTRCGCNVASPGGRTLQVARGAECSVWGAEGVLNSVHCRP